MPVEMLLELVEMLKEAARMIEDGQTQPEGE